MSRCAAIRCSRSAPTAGCFPRAGVASQRAACGAAALVTGKAGLEEFTEPRARSEGAGAAQQAPRSARRGLFHHSAADVGIFLPAADGMTHQLSQTAARRRSDVNPIERHAISNRNCERPPPAGMLRYDAKPLISAVWALDQGARMSPALAVAGGTALASRGRAIPDARRSVIASGAKQSIAHSEERVDCFVAFAPRNDADFVARVERSATRDFTARPVPGFRFAPPGDDFELAATTSRSRRSFRARFAFWSAPSETEGAGNAGRSMRPQPRMQ